ncbi:FtsX-like permease family protein [Draconibacterium orientale]|uniref:ABC transporter permease n=1 Tax=Draconibacterium orientale TaxID=1168034 RepID=UPI0029C02DB8|nr:FtsX-like permease family protein [Draconibacterium orientale]
MKNHLKIIIRNLYKNPTFGFVTIVGFAFSFAIALLLASYIFYEFSYDKNLPNVDKIYRLCADKTVTTFKIDLTGELKERYPEVEKLCPYDRSQTEVVFENIPFKVENAVLTNNDFFSIFSVKLQSGNPQNPLPDDNSLAISSSFAKTIFGNQNPVGQTINIQHRKDMNIVAVFEDFPNNSSIRADIIIPWKNVQYLAGEWRNGDFYSRVFFYLNNNNNPELLAQKITKDYSETHYSKAPFTLLPFSKSYTSFITDGRLSQTLHANMQSIILFSMVTILILIISILNFVILFTSNHLSRLKEIGIKKATGANRNIIFRQFIFEAITISFLAFFLGMLLAYIFKTPFINLIEKDFGLSLFLHFPNVLYIVAGVLLMGFLAGFYPAFIISKYKPVSIFSQSEKKGSLRIKSGLSVIQYAISIVLIVSLIVMTRQNQLLVNKDLGFTKEQLVYVDIPWEVKDKLPVIKEKLSENPYITSSTVSMGIPGNVYTWGVWSEAREKYNYNGNLPYFTVDADFFKVYDAEFIQGRAFEPEDWGKAVIMNESAFKLTGWKSIEGKEVKGIPKQAFGADPEETKNNALKVIGVIKDINVEKLNQSVAPTIFECSDHFGVSFLTCRVLSGNYTKVISDMKNVWDEVCPGYSFNYQFYDDWLDSRYKAELHTAYIIRIFAILSIILTCLGTFGIIHFVTRQRVKEVGIRKVNGAKIYEVVKILNWEIVKWIGLAFVLAVPLSWFIMNRYLKEFAYKTHLSWWIFALAGILALGIALLTVSWQSWRAATRNPVEALRYE